MSLEIKKIKLNRLEDFVKSKMFLEFEFIPISPLRVKSYLANPNASPDDIVLYLGFIDKQLVAFRSLFADVINAGNEQIRFGWCSGNWVHPDYRRNGFSEQLLNEAYSDWNKKLMFTNYAPDSEKLYLKTGWFQPIHQFEGIRAYLFPKTRKLLPASNNSKISKVFFSIIDLIIGILSSIRVLFFNSHEIRDLKFELIKFPDELCFNFPGESDLNYAFNRGQEEFKWIFNNPWIADKETIFDKKYPFSSYSKLFYYITVKVFSQNEFKGFFIFSVREGYLKTLYFNMLVGHEKEVAIFLKKYCKKNKIETATIYKKEVANKLFKRKFPFLHIKRYGQKIYSSFEINDKNNLNFQDADGDVIFT